MSVPPIPYYADLVREQVMNHPSLPFLSVLNEISNEFATRGPTAVADYNWFAVAHRFCALEACECTSPLSSEIGCVTRESPVRQRLFRRRLFGKKLD